MKRRSMRRWLGFTLPEVLVSITLVGLLAAVVIPTIAGQVKKGDSSHVGDDMLAIRGGVEQFLSDVRKYPNTIGELTSLIKTSGTVPLTGTATAFLSSDSVRWRGPYVNKDSAAATATGFGLTIGGMFETDTLAASGFTSTASGQRYVVATISGMDSASWALIDQQFDDGVALTGTIRYSSSGTPKMKFLIIPIQ
jgi:prepilin-type N-terminal cleavage/methylation domain-containing protein